jgi:DNA repair exonuclease SbcCD nuclease subunit
MSSTFRFVHCADLHFDAPFPHLSDSVRKRLGSEARKTVSNLIDLCLEEDAHALLIAGDLFDETWLTVDNEQFLLGEFERLVSAGVTLVACCGHSDPGRDGSRAHAFARLSERSHLFTTTEPREIVVRDDSGEIVGRVIGCGLTTGTERDNLVERFPDPAGPQPAVGMLHGTLVGGAGRDAVAICRPDDLAAKPYRYWALGHVHRREQVLERPAAHYPGPLIAHDFSEASALGALLVTLPASGPPVVEFHSLATVRWETIVLDQLDEVAEPAALRGLAEAAVDELRTSPDARDDQTWMLRLVMRGPCKAADVVRSPDERAALARVLAKPSDVLSVDVVAEGVTRPVDLDEYRDQPHVLSLALEVVEEALSDDALIDRLAPELLAGCPDDDPQTRRSYIRDLLTDLDREAAQVLLKKVKA